MGRFSAKPKEELFIFLREVLYAPDKWCHPYIHSRKKNHSFSCAKFYTPLTNGATIKFKPFGPHPYLILTGGAHWHRGKRKLQLSMTKPNSLNEPGKETALLSKNSTASTGIGFSDWSGGYAVVTRPWRKTCCRKLSFAPGRSWTASEVTAGSEPGCTDCRQTSP